jgi:nucleoside-diphosphate-sugar epimerase
VTIRWITPLLGTSSADDSRVAADVQIIDVRDLVDKAGNGPEALRQKILLGVECLEKGTKTVVCCDYGMSRSNAIAAGILAVHGKTTLDAAVRRVQEATGEEEIKLEPLESVRRAIKETSNENPSGQPTTVLVTGARGFIGTAVCRQLSAEGVPVVPLSRNELDLEQGSTRLSLLVAEHKVGCIVHLANPAVPASNSAVGRTLTMLRNVLDVCAIKNVHLIYPSGWEIYSGYSEALCADESLPAFPRGPYGETKYLAELLIAHWQRTTKIRCAVLRGSPVFGPGAKRPKFLFTFVEKAKASQPIVTHRYLNGSPAVDLLYVDDFVDAITRVCRQQYVGVLNLGTGVATSTRQVAEIVKAELGSSSSIAELQVDAHTASIAMNFDKARRDLGWEPKIGVAEGVKRLLAEST